MNTTQENIKLISLHEFAQMCLIDEEEDTSLDSSLTRFNRLPQNNQDAIKKEISNFSPDDLQETHRVLKKYFLLSVPDSIIIKALLNDIDLTCEVVLGSVSDTFARDILIDSIIFVIDMVENSPDSNEDPLSYWPVSGGSLDYHNRFHKKLKEQMVIHGLTFVESQ